MESKEIRTPEKNLLLGILTHKNGEVCIAIKNRCKEDSIPVSTLNAMVQDYQLKHK